MLSGSCKSEFAFPKKKRLLIPNEYQNVFRNGRKSQSRSFVIISCPNGKNYARLGLAVAKKSVPLAHDRNQIRRIIRETFRHYQPVLSGYDFIVMSPKTRMEYCHVLLRQELIYQWQSFGKSHRSSS